MVTFIFDCFLLVSVLTLCYVLARFALYLRFVVLRHIFISKIIGDDAGVLEYM